MATDRTGSTAINQASAATALNSAATAMDTFIALLDATSSTHLSYRQDAAKVKETIANLKLRVGQGDNLTP